MPLEQCDSPRRSDDGVRRPTLSTTGEPSTGDTGCSSHGTVAACVPGTRWSSVAPALKSRKCMSQASKQAQQSRGSRPHPGRVCDEHAAARAEQWGGGSKSCQLSLRVGQVHILWFEFAKSDVCIVHVPQRRTFAAVAGVPPHVPDAADHLRGHARVDRPVQHQAWVTAGQSSIFAHIKI